MLNGTLEIEGLDIELLVARVVDRTLRKRNIVLSVHRREDLSAFVISELWVASRKYDAQRYRSFRQFADAVAARKVVDWLRIDVGRSRWQFASHVYERTRPEFVSLDARRDEDRLDVADALGEAGFEAGRIDLRGLLTF